MTAHDAPEKSRPAFLEQFEEGSKDGNWMGVVWTLERNGPITVRMTTCEFHPIKYTEALLALKEVLDREIESELNSSGSKPLPLAPHLQTDGPQETGDSVNESLSVRPMYHPIDHTQYNESNNESNNEFVKEKKKDENVI